MIMKSLWCLQFSYVTPQEYKDLEQNSDPWICNLCNNLNFSESFFDTSLDLSHSLHENSKVDEDISSMILCYWFVAFATWVFYWS
jgi:5-methylthioribose kinase